MDVFGTGSIRERGFRRYGSLLRCDTIGRLVHNFRTTRKLLGCFGGVKTPPTLERVRQAIIHSPRDLFENKS